MPDTTRSTVVTIRNPQGLHLRPMDMFVKLASQFDAKIEILKGSDRVDGKSMLSMMRLASGPGTQLRLEATGRDAEAALEALAELVARGFGEMEGESAVPAPAAEPRPRAT